MYFVRIVLSFIATIQVFDGYYWLLEQII